MSVSLPEGKDNHKFQRLLLENYKIQVKVLPNDSVVQRGIRVAPHFYTKDEELELTVREIANILESKAYEQHSAVSAH